MCGCNDERKLNTQYYQDADYQIVMLETQCGSQMMSFLIYSNQGELFVVDGGFRSDANYLVEQIKSYGGHVNGWFISHYHTDHVGALVEILEKEELFNQIQIDGIYYNFPDIQDTRLYNDFDSILTDFNAVALDNSVKKIVCEKNSTWNFETVSVEVLKTYNPNIVRNFGNNSTSVYMFYMGSYKMCFLGDLGKEGGQELLENNSAEKLKCHIVQMAHHGQNGVSKDVYLALDPKVCFWPTPQWLWDNNLDNQGVNTGSWTIANEKQWIKELDAISYVMKDGKQVFYLYNTQ
jgi:beta-lactamase superfamily II metal-dependent hydrolase